jgi:anti-sigma regulatory factor (Ser/Thr protein kinase)
MSSACSAANDSDALYQPPDQVCSPFGPLTGLHHGYITDMDAIRDNAEVPEASTVGMSLPNDATAPGEARHAVRATLTRWRLPALVDACVLTVSELVTNAVRYGLPPISLVMRRRKGAVRIDVNDARPEALGAMGRSQPDQLAESGRGLAIVREVADDLGSEHIPGDGKKVYASWNVAVDRTAQERQTPGTAEHR